MAEVWDTWCLCRLSTSLISNSSSLTAIFSRCAPAGGWLHIWSAKGHSREYASARPQTSTCHVHRDMRCTKAVVAKPCEGSLFVSCTWGMLHVLMVQATMPKVVCYRWHGTLLLSWLPCSKAWSRGLVLMWSPRQTQNYTVFQVWFVKST